MFAPECLKKMYLAQFNGKPRWLRPVERQPRKLLVAGSNPARGFKVSSVLLPVLWFYFPNFCTWEVPSLLYARLEQDLGGKRNAAYRGQWDVWGGQSTVKTFLNGSSGLFFIVLWTMKVSVSLTPLNS